jgi:UDP-glucuronate decarboxylase
MSKLADMILEDAENIIRNVDVSEIQGKAVLVTGASGLIGGYFLASLKQASFKMARPFKLTAVMKREPLPYLREFLDYDGASVVCGDLTDQEFCKSLPQADYIIHAAGYGQPGRFMENQVKTLQLNTSATFSLFEKLLPQGKFLFISSSEVYGGLARSPYRESEIGTTNTTHHRACYIEGKRCGEAIVNAYRAKGVQAKSARLALAYGPGTRLDDRRVINSFIMKALHGRIDLIDRGESNRTYCHVSDAVEIMWKILLAGSEPVYNVGGISRITIADLACMIGNILHVPVVFPSDPKKLEGAPDEVWLDMAKVQNEFHKTGYVSMEEGLRRTIEWNKALYEAGEKPGKGSDPIV